MVKRKKPKSVQARPQKVDVAETSVARKTESQPASPPKKRKRASTPPWSLPMALPDGVPVATAWVASDEEEEQEEPISSTAPEQIPLKDPEADVISDNAIDSSAENSNINVDPHINTNPTKSSTDTRRQARPKSNGYPSGGGGVMGLMRVRHTCTVFKQAADKVRRVTTEGGETILVVGMAQGERLCFVGSARLRACRGHAAVCGYVLQPQQYGPYVEAHSPKWQSALVVHALEEGSPMVHACNIQEPLLPPLPESHEAKLTSAIENAVNSIDSSYSVVLVIRCVEPGPLSFMYPYADGEGLYARVPEEEVPIQPITAESSGEDLARGLHLPGFQVVIDSLGSDGVEPLVIPDEWAEAAEAIAAEQPPIRPLSALICGARGVGKSTLCRYLIHRLLARHPAVALMDCDMGQPECTPPGMVSIPIIRGPLLSPPHLRQRTYFSAYYVGAATSKSEPLYYTACLKALTEDYNTLATGDNRSTHSAAYMQSEVLTKQPPLVVNTDGWVKGMGHELLGATIDLVSPGHIIQVMGPTETRSPVIDRLPDGCRVYQVGPWGAAGTGDSAARGGTAAEQRTLRLISYFLASRTSTSSLASTYVRNSSVSDPTGAVAAVLSAEIPYMVPIAAVSIRIMNSAVSPNFTLLALNGALVGLLAAPQYRNHTQRQQQSTQIDGEDGSSHTQIVPHCLPSNIIAPCLGLGIVRSIDMDAGILYVITPVPAERLVSCTVLSKGSQHLPSEMLFDGQSCCHPYLSSEALTAGGGAAMKSRSNLQRRGGAG